MIPLLVPASSDAPARFVTRLVGPGVAGARESALLERSDETALFAGEDGLFAITTDQPLIGDVVCIDPARRTAERLIRANSPHNTFLITEQCDQLCVMCSQPPKKSHDDRFEEYRQALRLAPEGAVIGLSGGEPTLHKVALFALLAEAKADRPDLFFHILSNGQHFDAGDVQDIRASAANSLWGIPLYSHDPDTHDTTVAKPGAYDRLLESLGHCLSGGMRVELRTVLLQNNVGHLPALARLIGNHLGFLSQWSIMQLENIGFAKNRFGALYVDHSLDFAPLAEAIDVATLFGVRVSLFNMPRCSVPEPFRPYASNSISDWKRKYAPECSTCTDQTSCPGFFAWHPDSHMRVTPL